MSNIRCSCCTCVYSEPREINGKTCCVFCKATNSPIICKVCGGGGIKCNQFKFKCKTCEFKDVGCPLDPSSCTIYKPIRYNGNTAEINRIKMALENCDNIHYYSRYWAKLSHETIRTAIISGIDAYFREADIECLIEAMKIIGGIIYNYFKWLNK